VLVEALNPKSAFALTGSARTSTRGTDARASILGACAFTLKSPFNFGAETLAYNEKFP